VLGFTPINFPTKLEPWEGGFVDPFLAFLFCLILIFIKGLILNFIKGGGQDTPTPRAIFELCYHYELRRQKQRFLSQKTI
jgi:hypothetical protein